MIKEITFEEVKNKLEAWELKVEDYGNVYHEGDDMWVQYDSDGQMMVSLFTEVMYAETVAELIRNAEWYSCCGDVLDHDVPMCPTCKEWC